MSASKDMNKGNENDSVIVFSSSLVKELTASRLAPNYVGVRRVRPSSRLVAQAIKRDNNNNNNKIKTNATESVVFKVIDKETGLERRMTKKEKKEKKLAMKEAEKQRKIQAREEKELSARKRKAEDDGQNLLEDKNNESENNDADDGLDIDLNQDPNDRYVHLKIDPKALEEEVADLRGVREGVPPVMLSPPMSQLALNHNSSIIPSAKIDDNLAKIWVEKLVQSMKPAEETRQKEDMRPMPYRLTPEVWTRLRPKELLSAVEASSSEAIEENDTYFQLKRTDDDNNNNSSSSNNNEECWDYCSMRPPFLSNDDDITNTTTAVLSVLYNNNNTKLHIACGAKFGCDYLIYDGPRSERHAFAGIRILHPTTTNNDGNNTTYYNFPIPTPYDMAGYVRCLNTAGKLALIATVLDNNKVAIVDLALVKVIVTRRPTKTLEQRMKNLSKK